LVTFATRRLANYTGVIRCAKDGRLGVTPWPARGKAPPNTRSAITTEETPVQLPQLKRVRWAVRAALFLGVAASVAANILHAQPNPISQTISAWPPLALLLTVELTSRIPMHKPLLAFLRVVATIAIAGIAAWVSYWHMQDVAVKYGETEISAYLLPISVDGLIVVASVSLVELAGRIRLLEERRANAAAAPAAPAVAPVHFVEPAPAPLIPTPTPVPVFQPATGAAPAAPAATVPAGYAPDLAELEEEFDETLDDEESTPAMTEEPVRTGLGARVASSPLSGRPLAHNAPVSPAVAAVSKPVPPYANGSTPPRATVSAAVSAPARTMVTAPTTLVAAESNAPRQRRPIQETADLADEIEAMHPEISQTELARRLGISATRLRAVRREAREARRAAGRAAAR
jgi:hypothetical protein